MTGLTNDWCVRDQNSRIYWALARDNAVPFSGFFAQVSEKLSCPIPATLFVGTSSLT